jgi:phosphatidate cytidylyltransferase
LLKKRILSAIILLPAAIGIMIGGGWLYDLLIAGVTLIAGLEFVQMFRRRGYALSPVLIGGTVLIWEAAAVWPDAAWPAVGITAAVLIVTLRELIRTHNAAQRQGAIEIPRSPTEAWALTLACGLYLGFGGAHFIRLRDLTDGFWWTLTTCLIVWIGDSAAYFGGSRWGRHKMAPTISPGKSWEGYAAQIASGILSGAALGWLWPNVAAVSTITVWRGLVVGVVISALCPAGDFLVSMMKREVEVKDTSNLIPGHGGVLDRIDSLIWAVILAYIILTMI